MGKENENWYNRVYSPETRLQWLTETETRIIRA